MKSILLAAAIVIGAATCAVADMPGADWMTKEQVTTKLKGLGYSEVRKLEADETGTGKAMRSRTGRPTKSTSIPKPAS